MIEGYEFLTRSLDLVVTPKAGALQMRYPFATDNPYYAKLVSVSERPIENNCESLKLLRLVFQIYLINRNVLVSHGLVACRDLVIYPEAHTNEGLKRFSEALKVRNVLDINEWKSLSKKNCWVTILFGDKSAIDLRNQFSEIKYVNVSGMTINQFTERQSELHWVTTGRAAKYFACSVNTIRRKVRSLDEIHGSSLVQINDHGRRKINLKLLEALLSELDPQ